MSASNITAVILAGGRSQRMNGENKGLVMFEGQPLIMHVLRRLTPQIHNIVISANERLDEYVQFECPVIPDKIHGFAGPLAGMYTVMTEMATEWLITVPCDTPNIPPDYIARMQRAGYDNKVCVAHDGIQQQPGFCLLHKSLQEDLLSAISNQQLAVYKFLASHDATEVDFSDVSECFININTPEQLEQLEQHDPEK